MVDVHDKNTRSFNMSRIKSKDTKPELIVRKYLHSRGLRFRLHNRLLPGKPDLTFSKYKTVVNIQGCFWHKHSGCRFFVLPKTRTSWWEEKINKTVKRDADNNIKLELLGWNNLLIWECELRKEIREKTLLALHNEIICRI